MLFIFLPAMEITTLSEESWKKRHAALSPNKYLEMRLEMINVENKNNY